ncbi:hypothetical protein [Rhodococcus sp. (in: high G+C Gram-positive bacteria)]|uniref:hypothetical protein n=1 Tax=Rhodococcus sp. TaxID=1831 RepID=UPI001A1F57D8|nr:hypothetical protein [Rhodococcus sp. (in: high G+C Gram-positive bacteria)]MBJ7479241.1 hypothetical protein [Rhodococcus sp. (in: high G+C Gram-positive bacteria)]
MRVKITDLEKFAFEDVMRPYWPMLAEPDARYPKLIHSLDEVAKMLDVGDLCWRTAVFDRLYRSGIWFPDYIEHRLAYVTKAGMALAAMNAEVSS